MPWRWVFFALAVMFLTVSDGPPTYGGGTYGGWAYGGALGNPGSVLPPSVF